MRGYNKNLSSYHTEEGGFLDQMTIILLRDLFEKLAPGGSLLIQTRRHEGAREDAMSVSKNIMEDVHMHTVTNRAWEFLASSQNGYAGNPTSGYPTGTWKVEHMNRITTIHCKEGCIWICYQLPSLKREQVENQLLAKFGIHKSHDPYETYGVAVTFYILRFILKCQEDRALSREYVSLKRSIKALHSQTVKAAELRAKKVLKEESFDDMKSRLVEKRGTDAVVADATVAATA